jgi:hypothetical protein
MLPHQASEFYVYVHRRHDTRAIFYVGMGRGSRGENFQNRTQRWRDAAEEMPPFVEVVGHSMTELAALDLEAAVIDFALSSGVSLANVEVGTRELVAPSPPRIAPTTRARRLMLRCVDFDLDFHDSEEAAEWLMMVNDPSMSANRYEISRAALTGRLAAGLRWASLQCIA